MLFTCVVCNVEFEKKARGHKYKCCSKKCAFDILRAPKNTKCTECGTFFHMKKSQEKRYARNLGTFCSSKCCSKAKQSYYLGENNPNFKDIQFSKDGYLLSLTPRGRMHVHRKIVCEYLGFLKIPEGYQIHHRNCIKTDNRLENLAVLSNSDHRWLHKNFGNYSLTAYCDGRFSLKDMLSMTPLESKDKAEVLLPLNVLIQKQTEVVKSGELLGNLEIDNQQPS